jgi:hypothetical protein
MHPVLAALAPLCVAWLAACGNAVTSGAPAQEPAFPPPAVAPEGEVILPYLQEWNDDRHPRPSAPPQLIVQVVNTMGAAYALERLVVAVDGATICSIHRPILRPRLTVFEGKVVSGNHTTSVLMAFRGTGWGLFTYMRTYSYTLRSSHTFTATRGVRTGVVVRAYERGDLFTLLRDKPAVRFDVSQAQLRDRSSAAYPTTHHEQERTHHAPKRANRSFQRHRSPRRDNAVAGDGQALWR